MLVVTRTWMGGALGADEDDDEEEDEDEAASAAEADEPVRSQAAPSARNRLKHASARGKVRGPGGVCIEAP
jgi:hypothetical protein